MARAVNRVLLISDTYPPVIGGAGRAIQLLARGLVVRGREVTVATADQPGADPFEVDHGVAVHRLEGLSMRNPRFSDSLRWKVIPPFPDPELTWNLRRLINRCSPDLVHMYGWFSYTALFALIGVSVPVLLSARDYGNICALRTLVRRGEICSGPQLAKCMGCAPDWYGVPKATVAVSSVLSMRSLLARRIDGLHSNSTYVEALMHEHLVRSGPGSHSPERGTRPSKVIPSFRPEETTEVADEQILAKLPTTPFMLFVGSLRAVKGVHVLLDAYRKLESPPPLVFMGPAAIDMPDVWPEDVTVLFDVSHATVMAAWDLAMFGVAPSTWAEPLGNVVHEAMSRGKPVIGTWPGGMADMISDGEDGLLVPAGDVGALAGAMSRLIGDPEWCRSLGVRAAHSSNGFSENTLMPEFEELYEVTAEAFSRKRRTRSISRALRGSTFGRRRRQAT